MNMRILTFIATGILVAACGGGGGGGDGTVIVDPPITNEVVTRSFPATGFTGVAINGSFVSTVRQGGDFTVVLTVDADIADQLDVFVDGTILRVGFVPGSDIRATTLEAVVTMPALERVELDGSNHVDVVGFDGSTLDVDLLGSNLLRARDSAYDFLTAHVNGSVLFEFVEVVALPAGHIEVSGNSNVSLNMMDFATLTGSVMGTSTLGYYGDNLNLSLAMGNSATVVRLGASR